MHQTNAIVATSTEGRTIRPTDDYSHFSFVPEPIWNTIRGGGAEQPRSRVMPATAPTLVGRQKRMRICLQARQHTLTLRANLRFPQTMPTEADTCRKLPVPKPQATGWDNEPYSIAAQAGNPDAELPDLLFHLAFNSLRSTPPALHEAQTYTKSR